MQKILGDAKSVRSLLGQKYRIDYYQRDYKWEPKQIRELVEDLTNRFLQDFNKEDPREKVAEYGQYFLGSVIISGKANELFIVDGQQRMTSLTLLLIYLNNLQKNRDEEDKVKVDDLIYSTKFGKKSFNLEVPERTPCLQALINEENPDTADQSPSVQNLINRYNDIAELFPAELRDNDLSYFLDWLIEKVMLVEITAFSDNDAYTIFETMNDRGLSLTPTDMLKGYILVHILDRDSRARSDDVWKKQMSKLRELGKEEDADCIKSWLRSQYANSIRERRAGATPKDFDRIGTEFHRWVRENQKRVGLQQSDDFESLVAKDLPFFTRWYEFARRAGDLYTYKLESIFFNAQNNFTLQYPLMLSSLRLSDDEETVKLKMRLVSNFIEIVLARRMWNFKAIDYSTMQYRAFLIMKRIRGMEIEQLRSDLIKQLSREEVGVDDNIDFRTEQGFRLHRTNGPQVHRLLARLTEFIEVKSKCVARYPEYARRSSRKGGYQIEHLWANHSECHAEEFPNPHDFSEYRNRIGGLVLLPGPDNASLSDMAYSKKVKHYSKQNLLACSLHPISYENNPGFSQLIQATGLSFRPMSVFHKAELDERQELYTNLASLCWSPARLNDI